MTSASRAWGASEGVVFFQNQNVFLRDGKMRVSCDHGLAADGFIDDRWRGGRVVFMGPISSSEIFVRARYALRLFLDRLVPSAKFHYSARPQGSAPNRPSQNVK